MEEAEAAGVKKMRLEDILESKKVRDVVSDLQQVVTIPSTSTIEQGFQILSQAKVLSAPVYDETIGGYIGLVDMFDLLQCVIKVCGKDKEIHTQTRTILCHTWNLDANELAENGRKIAETPITHIMDKSELNPFCTVSMDTPLPELLFIFKKGIHRAIISDDTKQLQRIVSQSDIIKFLSNYLYYFGRIGQGTLEDIGLGAQKVVTLNQKARAIHGFQLLQQNKISAVAIVDDYGVLVANLSISDLRGLKLENLSSLMLPVLDYLKQRCDNQQLLPPVVCHPYTTFETLVLKLACSRVHRCWNVDDVGRPIGVVSLTDVIMLLDLRVYVDQEDKLLSTEKTSESLVM
jgi:CBS-domain-containing membrane protein